MSSRFYSLFRKIHKIDGRKFSTAIQVKSAPEEPQSIFRTTESNPANHNESHLNRYYTVPKNDYDIIYPKGALPNEFRKQNEIFVECSILVRRPAVEIISCLNQTDYTKPVNRYILYGKYGAGKTLTMAHLLHYAYLQKFILVHVPWINSWFRFPKEVTDSPFEPGMKDLPVDVGFWLKYFKSQNERLLTELQLTVSKDYEWTPREVTKAGEPLLDLINFGITRIKFACGVVNALVNELKISGIMGKCKTFIAIDGVNALFSDQTGLKDDHKKPLPANKISIVKTFLDSINYDWCNGAVLLTVDTRAVKENRNSDCPRYLLGKEGFEYLDPFVPVAVENYTADEFETVIEYYKDRKWLRNISPKGQKELELISHRNPFDLFHRCKPL